MLIALIACLGLFVIAFALMQRLKQKRADQRTQKIPAVVGGIAAWSIVAMVLVGLGELAAFVHHLFSSPANEVAGELESAAYVFVGALLGIVMVYRLLQAIDVVEMRDFFVYSLTFRGYEMKRNQVFDDLERHTVEKIHRESSDTPLPIQATPRRKPIEKDPEQLKQEFARLRSRPVQSIHLTDELDRLKRGETADISESWKMNSMRQPSHPLYQQITKAVLDPTQKILSLRVDFPSVTKEHLGNSSSVYRFKQEVYDLLLAISTEVWLNPYFPYFETITLTCYGIEADAFGQSGEYPFMKLTIPGSELRKLIGQFFDVGKLGTIANVVFKDGSPI